MKDIFITSGMRTDWNLAFNLRLCDALEQTGFTIHLPQRDSYQGEDKKQIFLTDVTGIDNSKMILAVGAKTQTSNWGFELGYCYKSGKPILALTDEEHPLDLMTSGAVDKILTYKNLDILENYIDTLVRELKSLLKQ